MLRVRTTVMIALLAAIPLEVLNVRVAAVVFDPGPMPASWGWKLLVDEWAFLHLPGGLSLDWFERVSGCQQHNLVAGCKWVDAFVLFGSGYLDTALVLAAIIFGVRWLHKLYRGPAVRPDSSTTLFPRINDERG